MRLEQKLEDIKREWTDHKFDADSTSELDELLSAKDSAYSTSDDGSFYSVSSWTTFTLPMERENKAYICGGLDVVASAKEGLGEISDMFFKTTRLANAVKTKIDEKMENRKQKRVDALAQEKRIEREMQMRHDAMHAREELSALANLWREGK